MRLEKAILIAMSLFILLCGPFFSLVPLDGGGMSIKDQPMAYTTIDSDYNVYSGEIKGIDSEQWIMNANIQINPGGTLYINSTDLLWGGTTDGQFGLYVDYGGKLIIDQKCNFSANDTTTHITGTTTVWDETWGIHWKFEIFGEAYIANSTLSYMWGANGNYLQDARGGIQCFSDDIMIYNVDIYNVEQCGISAVDKSGSSTSGFDPVIENVRISNTTGWGIFAGGSSGNPSVTNVTIKDSDYRGVQYFYGAYGKFENVTIDNCVDLAMTYDPITGGTLNLRNCTFTRSLYGYAARRGGTVNLFDCDLNNNIEYGLQLAHDTGYTQVVNMYGGNIKHNGKDGIGTTYVTGSGTISDVEIAYNGLNGTYIGPGLTMSIESCKIYENGEYGFVSNGSAGSLIGNRIYDNVLGNVLLYNGATTSVSNNVINSSVMGVDLLDSSPTITGNTISDNNVGLNVPAGNEPTVVSNKFNNNVRGGVVTEITGGDIEGNNFTGNAYAGLMLIDCMDLSVKESGFDGNNIGIEIIGGNFIDIKNVKIENSVDSGIFCHSGANISITNPSPKSTSITADPNTRALYYMNEGAGMITQDATANGNDGSLVNSPVWSQGKWGGALNFNGLDQYVAVADSPSLAISGNTLSIEAWIRVDQGSLGSTRMILNKEESYKVALNSDRYIMWAIMTTTTDWTWTTTDARVPIGAWSFIALTYDGSTVKTYVDGQIKDTDS
ncbi:MAG: right-handed parallel beta-helix repeat-containing protein, partial [Candidatus Thermoplasmatota archaeon]|nr:right-handed parallel beta-helix repeat-containing protein [Candidatus Thermoplasmatota archaeon]